MLESPPYCFASCVRTLCSSDEVVEPKAEVMLEFEFEVIELLEFDPPSEDPEVEMVPPLLLIERLEGVAAMGADTLAVWDGIGRAMVTGWFC